MNYNTQNAKIASITEKTLIVGIDVGSETHYARAFSWRNYEYLLAEPWSVPAGTGNEACTCESASCQEIQRAG